MLLLRFKIIKQDILQYLHNKRNTHYYLEIDVDKSMMDKCESVIKPSYGLTTSRILAEHLNNNLQHTNKHHTYMTHLPCDSKTNGLYSILIVTTYI